MPLVLSDEGLDDHPRRRSTCAATRPQHLAVGGARRPHQEPEGRGARSAIVGKYVSFEDSYKSLNEALSHGGFANDVRVVRRWVESEELEAGDAKRCSAGVDGILVPGGFGSPGHRRA